MARDNQAPQEQTAVILVRHGESTWHGKWKGQGDPPLSDAGREQARRVAQRLAREPMDGRQISALYCSDLRRAAQTAEIVSERLGLTPSADARLRELDIGEWSGLTLEEVTERFPEEYAAWRDYEPVRTPGGETFDEMQARAVAALNDLLAAHAGQTICVLTHGGVIYALRGHVLGIPRSAELFAGLPPNRNTAVTVLRHDGGCWEIVLLMNASHLDVDDLSRGSSTSR